MFYGWWIVILVFLAGAFGGATIWYGFTAFFDPLMTEFGWSFTAISFAASLRGVDIGLMDIFVGFLVDRFGSRKIILGGSMLVGIGYLMLSRINSLPAFYISFIIVFIGASGISGVVLFSLITRWFRKRLGLALGLGGTGYGAAGFALPGIVYLLDLVGLRTTFAIFGIAAFVIGVLATCLVRNQPEDMGYGPDGVPLSESEHVSEDASTHAAEPVVPATDYTFKEAISTPAFWIVTYVGTITMFSLAMVSTHIMPYLQHISYSRYMASIVAMMIPVTSVVGRLGIGWASDFMSRKGMLLVMVVGQIIGMAIFLYAHMSFLLIPFVIFFAIGFGGVIVLRAAILNDYYGSTYVGSLIGLCWGVSNIGGIGGPLLAGWVFDTTGSYSLAWIISGILLLTAALLVVIMKHPQRKGRECT